MKKLLCVLLIMIMTVSLFGCSGGDNADNGATEIRVWTSDAGGKAEWERLVGEFNQTTGKEKGIKIKWETYSDFGTAIEVARKNGQLPEIASVSDVLGYSKTGDIIPLSELPGGDDFVKGYDSKLVQGRNIIGDVVYNVPSSSNVPALMYNKDMFKAAGIVDANGEPDVPETWDEVREVAKKLTDTSKQVYGIGIPLKDPALFCNYMLRTHFTSSFGEMCEYDFENVTVNYDKYKYAFDWVLKIKEDESYFPGAESLDNDTGRAYFAEGKIGMYLGMSWDVGVLTSQFVANCDWGVAPCPVAEGVERQNNWRDISGSYTVCKSAKDTDLEKVMEVYKFIFSLNTRKCMYEAGVRIPCKKDAVEAADASKIPAQLNDFAELLDEEYEYFVAPSVKLEGDPWTATVSKLWAGSIGVDEAVKDINDRYTAALKAGVADGTVNIDWYK